MNKKNNFLTIFIVTLCAVSLPLLIKQPYVETASTLALSPAVTFLSAEPVTTETVDPVPWNTETHKNGYCREGICPYFTVYPEPPYSDNDVEMLAKTVWGEARGCTLEEWRLVVWCVLQRYDAEGWGDTIEAVITAKNQFVGYHAKNPIDPAIYGVCAAELADWAHGAEPPTHETYAPTVPYYYFDGIGGHNWFREVWR